MEWRQTGAQQQKQMGSSQRQPASVRPKEADRHPGQTHGHPESQTLDLRARALGSCWSTWGNITCKTPALRESSLVLVADSFLRNSISLGFQSHARA